MSQCGPLDPIQDDEGGNPMIEQVKEQERRGRLALLQEEIDAALGRYLTVAGPERSQLTIQLLRLRWEVEELEAAGRTSSP